MIKKAMFLYAAVILLTGAHAAEWKDADALRQWRANKNVQYKVENNAGKLYNIGRDCSIVIDNLDIIPAKYNFIRYKYRSFGNTSRSGQLFWAAPGEKFSERRKLLLPGLKADGKWHTHTVWFSKLPDIKSWTDCSKIVKLRLDPSDNPGGTVELTEISLGYAKDVPKAASASAAPAGKLPRFTPALDAPAWKAVKVDFHPEKISRVANESYFTAKMIQAAEDLSPEKAAFFARSGQKNSYCDFFLRRNFILKAKPEKAFLQFVADDSAVVYINGKKAGSTRSWYDVKVIDVGQYLTAGKNVLAVHYRNSGNVGGVLTELFVQYSDGSFERINSDESFVATISPRDDWNQINGAIDYFKKVVAYDAPPARPWRRKLVYKDFSALQILKDKSIAPRQAVGGDKIRLQYVFEGKLPALPFSGTIKINKKQHQLWNENITLTAKNIRKLSGQKWQLTIEYVLPMYFSANDLEITFQSGTICVEAEQLKMPFKLIARSHVPGFEKACRSQVRTGAYGPYMEVNGKPFFHVGGEDNIFPKGDPPLNVIEVPTVFNEWWTPEGEFLFEAFDRNAEKVSRLSPDAYFFMNISLSIPRAWLDRHPEARCLDDKNKIVRDGYGSIRDSHAFGSQEVLAEMRKALIKAIEYLEKSPYANRIAAYRIVGGHTIEWLGWTPERGRAVDFSSASKKAFKTFALKNYPELKDHSIPSFAARGALDDKELIWDPQKHLNVIAHNDYYSNAVVDYVIDLCRTARKAVQGRKMIGTYYGYTMTLNNNGISQMRAHYALKKLLDARCVDFIMSPQPYNVRNFGDTYGDMKPFGSITRYNIVSLQEDDTRTNFSQGGVGCYQAPNTELCVEILRRSMGFNLCRNMPILFISQPGHYENEQIRRDLVAAQTVGQHCLEKQPPRRAEIALVVSEKSISYSPMDPAFIRTGHVEQIYMPNGSITVKPMSRTAFSYDSFGQNYTTWARVGAPADYLLAEDLADNPGDYKLYVFVNCQVYDQKFLRAVEKLRQKDCTLLWMYAPGYTFDNRNSVENMRRLTGLIFKKLPEPLMPAFKSNGNWVGTPTVRVKPLFAAVDPAAEVLGRYEDGNAGFVRKKSGKSTTYFMGIWRPDLQTIRKIAAAAGVRICSETGDPLEANGSLIAFHARSAGQKSITLPCKTDVLDVFNKKIIARNVDKFTFDVKLHESPLFYYGNDAAEVLKKLERKK